MMLRGVKSMIFSEILPLHHAAESQIAPLHFANTKMQNTVGS
jgi:hypothetical protein